MPMDASGVIIATEEPTSEKTSPLTVVPLLMFPRCLLLPLAIGNQKNNTTHSMPPHKLQHVLTSVAITHNKSGPAPRKSVVDTKYVTQEVLLAAAGLPGPT